MNTNPELLVVVPYHNRQDTIQRTVDSILSQTYGNLQLLVVDDASETPARDVVQPDPNIRFFDMRRNQGTYFINAVASRANPYRLYTPHDSDDVSVPERVEMLKAKMDSAGLDVVYNLVHRVNLDGTEITMPAAPFHEPISRENMVHRAPHLALYKNDVLRNTGGYHPGFRVGYDTFMINVLKMVAKTGIVEEPLYIVHKTADSLTLSPATGADSAYRARVIGRLVSLYGRCFDSPGQTKSIIEGSIYQKTRCRMIAEIRRLKKEMKW